MDIMKRSLSVFSSHPAGYSPNKIQAETLSEDEEDCGETVTSSMSISTSGFVGSGSDFAPVSGGPFSALTPSMWPQEILEKLAQSPESDADFSDYHFDEFGYKIDNEIKRLQADASNHLLDVPFIEDPQQRLKWIAFLEFTHSNVMGELTWDKVKVQIPISEKLRTMVRQGIPHSLRIQIWMRLCGALSKRLDSPHSYKDLVKASSNDHLMTSKQIEKDLLRTMANNICFSASSATGIPRLRRILRALAWLYPDIGYCQGTGVIVATLLLFMEEEDAFWMMCTIVEDLLPASYYSSTLIGVQADQRVLKQLVSTYLPEVEQVLVKHDIELSLITLHWFMTLFSSVVHIKFLLRLWDILYCDGSIVLFQLTLAMLKLKEVELMHADSSAQIFNLLSDLPSEIHDVEQLIAASQTIASDLTTSTIDSYRRKNLAYLMADQGAIINPEIPRNLPKQTVSKRQLESQQTLFSIFWSTAEENEKTKNIKQTETLVDLRDGILQIGRYFKSLDADLSHVSLEPDYTLSSHSKDVDHYIAVSRNKGRRAKALLDFQRHDDDELGFRKNDVITIISMRDEHCWVGEVNGLRGWFPAKFVELLDERSKHYSSAGDDGVSETITDLVRGTFCPALKAVFEHGMKKSLILGGHAHPWLFIEEAATREIERDFDSVYSRLVLCKTFRLDEDGKVLTPEELLYRAIQAVNLTHDAAHASMDVKLRSLICCGLNDQVLHLWMESLCACTDIVEKWYQRWAFMRSPGWVQIKCDLRVLSQFPFVLDIGKELSGKPVLSDFHKNVQDMLTKHYLFSWES